MKDVKDFNINKRLIETIGINHRR